MTTPLDDKNILLPQYIQSGQVQYGYAQGHPRSLDIHPAWRAADLDFVFSTIAARQVTAMKGCALTEAFSAVVIVTEE